MEHYGHLTGSNPNPYRQQAQLFTLQETHQALERCLQSQWLEPQEVSAWRTWLDRQCEYIRGDERPCLVHADLHVANIRFQQKSPQKTWELAGIIDFEHAKAWLPEYDLVLLRWQVHAVSSHLWDAFVRGYGHDSFPSPERMRLFEVIKVLMVLGSHGKDTAYGQWAWKVLTAASPF
jgi:Ser/Thr protein kinase RdoA (MazF antagonist)